MQTRPRLSKCAKTALAVGRMKARHKQLACKHRGVTGRQCMQHTAGHTQAAPCIQPPYSTKQRGTHPKRAWAGGAGMGIFGRDGLARVPGRLAAWGWGGWVGVGPGNRCSSSSSSAPGGTANRTCKGSSRSKARAHQMWGRIEVGCRQQRKQEVGT